MNDDKANRSEAVRQAILRYLDEHPRASDTVAGISERWLPEEGVSAGRELVESVLDALAQEGRVRVIELPDGARAFGGPGPAGRGG